MNFEYVIISLFMIAALMTKDPRKLAILIVVLIELSVRFIESYGLQWSEAICALIPFFTTENSSWINGYLIVIAQCLTSLLLICSSTYLKNANDRLFYRIMALFLILTSSLIPLYYFDVILSFQAYTGMYHALAILQVMIVYWFSDGFRGILTNSVNYIHSAFTGSFGMRGGHR